MKRKVLLLLLLSPMLFRLPRRVKKVSQKSFGFCNLSFFEKAPAPVCAPCRIKQTPLALDPEYAQPFWGEVEFPPVTRFFVNTHDPIKQDVFISGSVHAKQAPWDKFIWDLIVRVSKKPGLVVDVGANIGYFSLLAAALGHQVVAFEPMNRNVAKFWSSVETNHFEDKITLFQNAVVSEKGLRVALESTHHTNQGNGRIVGVGEWVDTVALDDLVHSDVLLLKIDVEGFEGAVLDGARALLSRRKVQFITM